MASFSFKPKQITKKLLTALPARAREVIVKRYGLNDDTGRMTLEAIGKKYGITRERVRQIENYALSMIRKSDEFDKENKVFHELADVIDAGGAIIAEEDFLKSVSKDKSTRNHIHFLLVIGDAFVREREDDEFRLRWYVDKDLADTIHESLRKLYGNLSDNELVTEPELIKRFLNEVDSLNQKYKNEEIIKRWLSLSKNISKNPLGEWGRSQSSNVKVKGMRDFVYLAIKRHGSPMHFREVAEAISSLFDRKAHEATCHNELIKDNRFVLVGRGLYALTEWGYTRGVVKDVIRNILEKDGPLSREEIIDKVRNERYVKDNTIVVNLQDSNLFQRDQQGLYSIR